MLGERSKRIYDFIVKYNLKMGRSPTVREICAEVGLRSTSSVMLHINNLEKEGLLRKAGAKGITLNDYVMISIQELSALREKANAYNEIMKERMI